MKTILVPTDFSPAADNAIHFAAQLSHCLNAGMVLLNSYHVPVYSSQMPVDAALEEQALDNSRKNLQSISEKIKSGYSIAEIECISQGGLATDNIVALAQSRDVDIIIMGTKGATGLKEVLLGSNASAVIESAVCPVLVVPAGARFNDLKKIVFTTDFNESDFQSLKFLLEVAAPLKSEIDIVHVSADGRAEGYEQDLLSWIKDELKKRFNISCDNLSFHLLTGKNVEEELNRFVEKNKADLVAMTTRSRNFVSKIFEKSLTKKMAFHARVPLLSFHEITKAG
jgi:nucleotide-binding universal stress UspA family protein